MSASDSAPLQNHQSGRASWFAIHTQHQHEKVAAQALASKGFEVFLPLYTAVRHWSDRTKELTLPLFPNYLFLHGGLDRQLSILAAPGVYSVVTFGGVPAAIPDAEIEAVRQAIAACTRIIPYPFLKCGDWVQIKCGPLEGFEGILVRIKNQFRLILSVELLEKSVAVEVEAWAVERVQRLQWREPARSFAFNPQPTA